MSTHTASVRALGAREANGYAVGGLAVAGLAVVGLSVWAVARSSVLEHPQSSAILRGAFTAAWIAVGTYMWATRPRHRLGLLVAGVGFLYAVTGLMASSDPLVHTLGRVSLAAFIVYYGYVVVCFPGDSLSSERDRRFLWLVVAATAIVWPLVLLFSRELPPGGALTSCGSHCPENPLRIATVTDGPSDVVNGIATGVTAVTLIAVGFLLVAKARSPLRLRRRAVEPVLYALLVQIAAYVVNSVATPTGRTFESLRIATAAAGILIPAGMLVGQERARSYAAGSLAQLVTRVRGGRVTPARMQELLRDALGDPTLELALWDRQRPRFVSVDGELVDPSLPGRGRRVTRVLHGGRPVAALNHSAALDEADDVVEGLAETALMLLENTQLVDELRESRARLVASADQERHRLERDLHDGAQQRLFLLQVKLARLRRSIDDETTAARLSELEDDAIAALEELRVLAHGIYPTVLVDRGVPEALRAVALDTPIPVRVVDRGFGRCSATIEAALYFCTLEALQNVAKHAGPDARATVELSRSGERIDLVVADDGLGFREATGSDGIGVMAMRDRIGAVGGELDIASEPGAGVTVHVTIAEAPERLAAVDDEAGRWRSE